MHLPSVVKNFVPNWAIIVYNKKGKNTIKPSQFESPKFEGFYSFSKVGLMCESLKSHLCFQCLQTCRFDHKRLVCFCALYVYMWHISCVLNAVILYDSRCESAIRGLVVLLQGTGV